MMHAHEETGDASRLIAKNSDMEDLTVRSSWRCDISRRRFHADYNIRVYGVRWIRAETDFNTRKRISELTISEANEDALTTAMCHMPWASRKIHLGFTGFDPLQGTQWEEMERQSKMLWGTIGEEVYRWTTHLPGTEKVAHLLWTTKVTKGIRLCGMGYRSYTLRDAQSDVILAEFVSYDTQFTGGTFELYEPWQRKFPGLELKALTAFLAIYETGRRRAHRIVYRPSKEKKPNVML